MKELNFWQAIKNRRSYYGFTDQQPVSQELIENIIQDALTYVPSAFHSQSARMVLLFGEHHKKLWELTVNQLKKVTPADQFDKTKQKVEHGFATGYGTILFFEDQSVVDGLMKRFSLYADNFPVWSQQSSGMHQFVVWTALESLGLGASLQHYNPLIDEDVQKQWNIDPQWKLLAQMPFGHPAEQPDDKQFQPLEARMKVFR